jgi:signal transduction histidine kinase
MTGYPVMLLAILVLYLSLLFLLAYWGEKNSKWFNENRTRLLYVLSVQVYCTSWTFYGSIGFASHFGLEYLAVYTGPVIVLFLSDSLLKKILKHVKREGVSTVSDFLSSRYGGSRRVATTTSIVLLIAMVPYIGLQVKALSNSFSVLAGGSEKAYIEATVIALAFLALIAILYGGRYLDFTRPQLGLLSTVAFQSFDKIVLFLFASIFVVFAIGGGPQEIFKRALLEPQLRPILSFGSTDHPHLMWVSINIASAIAFIFLPRQFHTIFVQNRSETDLHTLRWFSMLYLLLINLFVIPVALAGELMHLPVEKADEFFLSVPLKSGFPIVALLVFIGGFSAAAAMILVESIAVSKMLVTDVVLPVVLPIIRKHGRKSAAGLHPDLYRVVLYSTRLSIPFIILMGFLYAYYIGKYFMLVEIGLASFVGVAQIAPAFLMGIFFKDGNKSGAFWGIVTGTLIWIYTMILPSMAKAGIISDTLVNYGPFGIHILSPVNFLGVFEADPITNALFWSLFFNFLTYLIVSSLRSPSSAENDSVRKFFGEETQTGSTLTSEIARIQSDIERLLTISVGPSIARSIVEEGFTRDSTRLSKMLDDFTATLDKEKRLASIGELSASIAHDLRSPIAAIRLSLGDLEDLSKDSTESQKTIQNAKAAIGRIERLINDILWYSRADLLKKSKVNLARSLSDAVNLFTDEAERRNVKIELNCDDSIILDADSTRLNEIFTNVLLNALEAVKDNDGRISIIAKQVNDKSLIEFTDNGKGISNEIMSKIFVPFFTTKQGGTGLGLPIVKRLVNAHGGEISVQSIEGKGTTVTIVLPLQ